MCPGTAPARAPALSAPPQGAPGRLLQLHTVAPGWQFACRHGCKARAPGGARFETRALTEVIYVYNKGQPHCASNGHAGRCSRPAEIR